MSEAPRDWDDHYKTGHMPWDSGLRSRELSRVVTESGIKPCRAADLGCGTGTNAVWLAQQGFAVTGFDISALALSAAQEKAEQAGVQIPLMQVDLCRPIGDIQPFDFVFDRGCYHCARKVNLPGFLDSLKKLTHPGTKYLSLTGNANEQTEQGPPRLREDEIRADLGELFEFDFVRPIRFVDKGGIDGPLGWSCLMTRKA